MLAALHSVPNAVGRCADWIVVNPVRTTYCSPLLIHFKEHTLFEAGTMATMDTIRTEELPTKEKRRGFRQVAALQFVAAERT